MHPRHRKAIREGLARADRVVVADRTYALVIRKLCQRGQRELFSGLVLEAGITRFLDGFAPGQSPDTEEGRAIHYARDHAEAFLRWCRRHERRVAEIIAETPNP